MSASKTFSCAGKVFITGEYACIEGGPALVGTVGPEFTLELSQEAGEHPLPFAAGSPAGLFLAKHADTLRGARLTWRDPYTTPIGVGSSSAQFLLSVAAVCELLGQPRPGGAEILELYWQTVGKSQGVRPSGVDVVAQWLGGPLVVRNKPYESRKLSQWSGEATFLLAFTGSKAKTHEHLLSLSDRGFPHAFGSTLTKLNIVTLGAVEAWETGRADLMGRALTNYQQTLSLGGLAPKEFTAEIESVARTPGVLGAKGSGAQGGDCALLLVENDKIAEVSAAISARGWQPITVSWK